MRPSAIVALPENTGWRSGPSIAAVSSRPPGAAHVAGEALQDAEVGVAGDLQAELILAQADRAGDLQARVLADQLQIADVRRGRDRA